MTNPGPAAAVSLTGRPGPAGLLAGATASRNAWLAVDLDALAANVVALRSAMEPGVEFIAVVKANAYGAGIRGVAPALERAGVERFAVVWASEAVELRALGITRPIIVLGHSFPADADAAVELGVILTIDSFELAEALAAAATRRGMVARAHLHVDSGLHRDGLGPADAVALAARIRGLPGVELEGLSTHMANADEPDDGFSLAQGDVFAAVHRELDWIPYRHTANSATALRRAELRYSGVRVGLALHGILPENTSAAGLRPILSLHARLARVFTIEPGEGVSYGLTWRANRPSTIALVPIGYADGWRRSLGNAGDVLVGGRRCPIVGRICMDQFLVDVTDAVDVMEGDEAVLIGRQVGAEMTADEVARRAGTIPWDVFASLQARLPRIYHRGDAVELID